MKRDDKLTFRLTGSMKAELERRAGLLGISTGQLINEMISRHLDTVVNVLAIEQMEKLKQVHRSTSR